MCQIASCKLKHQPHTALRKAFTQCDPGTEHNGISIASSDSPVCERAIHGRAFFGFLRFLAEKKPSKLFLARNLRAATGRIQAPFFSRAPKNLAVRIASKPSIQNGLSRQLNFPRCNTTGKASREYKYVHLHACILSASRERRC